MRKSGDAPTDTSCTTFLTSLGLLCTLLKAPSEHMRPKLKSCSRRITAGTSNSGLKIHDLVVVLHSVRKREEEVSGLLVLVPCSGTIPVPVSQVTSVFQPIHQCVWAAWADGGVGLVLPRSSSFGRLPGTSAGGRIRRRQVAQGTSLALDTNPAAAQPVSQSLHSAPRSHTRPYSTLYQTNSQAQHRLPPTRSPSPSPAPIAFCLPQQRPGARILPAAKRLPQLPPPV